MGEREASNCYALGKMELGHLTLGKRRKLRILYEISKKELVSMTVSLLN